MRRRTRKSDPKVSTATQTLTCAGCGERFQARDNDWVALATGAYVHWGGRWGKVAMKPTAKPTETKSEPMRHEAWMRKAAQEADRLHKKLTEKMSSSSSDLVHKPSHYNQAGIECIEAIRASLGPEGFRNYCQGNAMKYLWRHKYKNGKQDIEKAQVYLNWLHEAYDD